MSSDAELLPQPTLAADAWRLVFVFLLVAFGVQSAGSAITFLTFVPVLLGLRLIRSKVRLGAVIGGSFGLAALIAGSAASGGVDWVPERVLLLLAVGSVALGSVHARAVTDALPVGAPSRSRDTWPEPSATRGFQLVLAAWMVVIVSAVALAAPSPATVEAGMVHAVHDAYTSMLTACDRRATTDAQRDLCTNIRDVRDDEIKFIERRPMSLFGGLLGLRIVAGAGTAHLLMLWRAHRSARGTRRLVPLAQLEFHWSSAYVVTAGIAAVLAAESVLTGTFAAWVEAAGVALLVIGGGMLSAQGLGLFAWLGRDRQRSRFRKVLVVIGFLVFAVYLFPIFFVAGVLDSALRPRRRNSGTLSDRGSGPAA